MGLINYLRDVKGEIKHVSWPTRHQAIVYTNLVIIVSIVIAIYLGFFDWLFTELLDIFVV